MNLTMPCQLKTPARITVNSGDTIHLSAEDSADREENQLSYKWFY